MHILIAAVSSASAPTGICRYAANLARGLTMMGGDTTKVTLVVGAWQADYFRTAFQLDEHTIQLRTCHIRPNAMARNLWYVFALPILAKAIGADIVHLTFPAPLLGRPWMPCPIVGTIHDLYPFDQPENFGLVRVTFNRLFLRCCLRNSDALACVSDYTRKRLAAIGSPATVRKTWHVYNCLGPSPSSSRPPALPGLGDRPFLLAVAQHRANKNLHLLLQAFANCQKHSLLSEAYALVLVGSAGPETRRLSQLIAQLNQQKNIFMLQSTSDSELSWLYRNAELLVAPSRIEGFCFPVIEALHYGCRVVCSDIAVFHEIGGASCEYFDLHATDPVERLAHAIATALTKSKPTLPRRERFSLKNMTAAYCALYAQLCGRHMWAQPVMSPERLDGRAG